MKLYRQELLKIFRAKSFRLILILLIIHTINPFDLKSNAESWDGADAKAFKLFKNQYEGLRSYDYTGLPIEYEEIQKLFRENLPNYPPDERINKQIERQIKSSAYRAQEWDRQREAWRKQYGELQSDADTYDERLIEKHHIISEQIGDIDRFYYSHAIESIFYLALDWFSVPLFYCIMVILVTAPLFTNEKTTHMLEITGVTVKGSRYLLLFLLLWIDFRTFT